MAAQFQIREYRPEDEGDVLALLRLVLGGGRAFQRTDDFWRWKHDLNPFGRSLRMVAVNHQILGLRAFMRWRFRAGPHTLEAVRAVDTATHPDYRRHGIFATLTDRAVAQARAEGVDLIFNTPNRYSLPGYLKLGWHYLGRPRLYVKIVRPWRIIRVLSGRHAQERNPHPDGAGIPAAEMLAQPRGLEALLAASDKQYSDRIHTDRSVAFMQWRYAAGPTLPYWGLWHGRPWANAAVLFRVNRRHGLQEIMLSDLLLSGAPPDAVGLIRRLIDAVDADYLVAHAPRGSTQARVLRRAGFIPLPRVGPYFTVRVLSPLVEQLGAGRLARWALSLGDLEVF